MVASARFCDAVVGRPLETTHRQVAAWRRRDGISSRVEHEHTLAGLSAEETTNNVGQSVKFAATAIATFVGNNLTSLFPAVASGLF